MAITLDELTGAIAPKTKKIKAMQDIENSMFIWLEQLVTSQFKWEELPKEIPFYALEQALFWRGSACFFKVADNYFCLPCAQGGDLTIYGQPLSVYPIGFNGVSLATPVYVSDNFDNQFNLVGEKNGVLIRNNQQSLSTYYLLKPYMNRLMYIWQTIGIHECMARVKMIIHCNKDVAKALKLQLDAMFDSANPIALVSDNTMSSNDTLDTIDFNVDYNTTPMWEDFDNTLNMMLTICGLNNSEQADKKERLLVDEVNANNQLISASLDTRLQYRQDACKQIKELFNLDVRVVVPSAMVKESTLENEDTENGENVDN